MSVQVSKFCQMLWIHVKILRALVCVCLLPSTMKVSSVWGWNSRKLINDVVLKTFLSSAKSLHRYFSMKHQVFLTGRFILFTHQKKGKAMTFIVYVLLTFKTWGLHLPLSGIAVGPCYIVRSRSACCISTHERGCNLTKKG